MNKQDMVQMMRETGALQDLDISERDFLEEHGRADIHVALMERAYALGRAYEVAGLGIGEVARQSYMRGQADERALTRLMGPVE